MHVLLSANIVWTVANFRRPIIKMLLAEGHKVSVLAAPDPSLDKIADLNISYVPLQMDAKGLSPASTFGQVGVMRRQFAQLKPDIVLSFTIKNNVFGAFAARRAGIPFVPNITGLGTAFLSGKAMQFLTEQLYRRAFRDLPLVLMQNEDDRALFIKRGLVRPEQVRLLPGSGVDLVHFAPTPYPGNVKAPVFLMIGRLLGDKGVAEFVAAADLVKRRFPHARFQLLGPFGTDNRSGLGAKEVEQWTSRNLIEYLGETSDVRPHISAADCVVLPSYREGSPRSLLEAAAMARPLIATDVPGCRSVVEDERTGYLCRAKDPESLAEAVERLLDLPVAERAEMGERGRQKMKREYDQSIVIDVYRQVVQEYGRGS